jgi:hypothetical protein
MAIYVDEISLYNDASIKADARGNGNRWSHLIGDTDEELHAFAALLGLKRSWFQAQRNPALNHYDVVPSVRARAIRMGAIALSGQEFREKLAERVRARNAGLHAADSPQSRPPDSD